MPVEPKYIVYVSGMREDLDPIFTSPLLLRLFTINLGHIHVVIDGGNAKIRLVLPKSYLFDPAWSMSYSKSLQDGI